MPPHPVCSLAATSAVGCRTRVAMPGHAHARMHTPYTHRGAPSTWPAAARRCSTAPHSSLASSAQRASLRSWCAGDQRRRGRGGRCLPAPGVCLQAPLAAANLAAADCTAPPALPPGRCPPAIRPGRVPRCAAPAAAAPAAAGRHSPGAARADALVRCEARRARGAAFSTARFALSDAPDSQLCFS